MASFKVSRLQPGSITADLLAVGAPSTDQVMVATAGASVGAVGTYAYASSSTNIGAGTTWNNPGTTRAGSSLRYSGYYGPGGFTAISASALAGTWLCMGFARNSGDSNTTVHTLWLRIS